MARWHETGSVKPWLGAVAALAVGAALIIIGAVSDSSGVAIVGVVILVLALGAGLYFGESAAGHLARKADVRSRRRRR